MFSPPSHRYDGATAASAADADADAAEQRDVFTEEFPEDSLSKKDSLRLADPFYDLPNEYSSRHKKKGRGSSCLLCIFTPGVFWIFFVACLALIGTGIALLVTGRVPTEETSSPPHTNNIFEREVDDPTLNVIPPAGPELSREETLFQILQTQSRTEDLTDSTTDQFATFQWLLNDDPAELDFKMIPVTTIEDRYKAALLYFSLSKGGGWNRMYNFLTESDICDWNDGEEGFAFEGIGCDEEGRVMKIVLDLNLLKGSIPTEIALFDLRTLGLGSNALSGTIPSEMGTMTSLEKLRLGGNDLSGELPDTLGSLIQLDTLLLQRNSKLEGRIPTSYRSLLNLKSLYIEGTNLTGNVDLILCGRKVNFTNFYANCDGQGKIECSCCTHCCNEFGVSCREMV